MEGVLQVQEVVGKGIQLEGIETGVCYRVKWQRVV